jgi:alpha-1,6-mannosyltransferase
VGRRVSATHRDVRGDGRALRVLDLTEFYSPRGGGVRAYLTAKADWLSRRPDAHHAIVAPGPRDTTTALGGSLLHTIAGPPVPGAPGYHVLLRGSTLRAIIRQERPDVIELGSIYSAPWLLRQSMRHRPVPIVGFYHMNLVGAALRGLPPWTPASVCRGVASSLSAYTRAVYADCRVVIGTSETAIAALRAVGIARTALVPFGVDTATFHPAQRDPTWRTEVGVAASRPVALYVGRLAREKNLEVLLRALPELGHRAGVTLVCIGDGPLRPKLERLARDGSNNLVLLPFESDRRHLARAYASADVFVAPCAHETFGLAALEAAASGLPVAGAAEGAVGALLAGQSWGRTFSPRDATELVTAVTDLLRGDRETLGRAARETAEGFSWDRAFEELLAVYREVVEGGLGGLGGQGGQGGLGGRGGQGDRGGR